MIFDILLISGILIMLSTWRLGETLIEGSEKYKFWYCIFNLGFWMTLTGFLKYIL